MSPKRNPKFKSALFLLIPTSSVEGRDTCMDLENFYVTLCFSHDGHLTLVEYIKPRNTQSAYTKRETDTDRDTFFFLKKCVFFTKKNCPAKKKNIKKCPVSRAQGWGALLPC
jgi:hypothetical protein